MFRLTSVLDWLSGRVHLPRISLATAQETGARVVHVVVVIALMTQSSAWAMTYLAAPEPAPAQGEAPPPSANAGALAELDVSKSNFGKLPLSFRPNVGQTDPAVRFQVSGLGGTLFFTPGEVVLSLHSLTESPGPNFGFQDATHSTQDSSVVRLRFEGTNPAPEMAEAERLPGIVNYFLGNDPAKWHTDLPTYAGVIYRQLYPGIDLRYDGTQGMLKGVYTVAPGADPAQIRWRYQGAASVNLNEVTGDLLIELASAGTGKEQGVLVERAPLVWQTIGSQRVSITARYIIAEDGRIGFALGQYDHAYGLTIDPTIEYRTYLGGSGDDAGYAIAVDSLHNVYVTGYTASTDFPIANPVQSTNRGNRDVFVLKLNPSGNALLYSTYLGGSGLDEGRGIALDSTGNAYLVGYTDSTDFPIASPLQGAYGGGRDVFVAKLNAEGSALLYSTYLGGSSTDEGYGVATDNAGAAYITGRTVSTNFPTANPLQASNAGGYDAFVMKLNTSGSMIAYSTYLGGSGLDASRSIAVDSALNAHVAGDTDSTDFPTASPLQATGGGGRDGFVAKLNATGSAFLYSTYLGGNGGDGGDGIAADSTGNTYVTGYTDSTNFPTANSLQATKDESRDAFVVKLNASGSTLSYGTYLGGNDGDRGYAIAVDSSGNAYIAGHTGSTNFPTASPLQATPAGLWDVFVAKLNATGSALSYSTYLGGNVYDEGRSIAVDNAGNAYIAGYTRSTNFPTANALQSTSGGLQDASVAKINTIAGGSPFSPPAVSSAASFVDVPSSHWAYQYIEALYAGGYIAGCRAVPRMYCPDKTLDRAEAAVFVERGLHGTSFTPANPTTQICADVTLDKWSAKWFNALYLDGYLAGCATNPLRCCPDQSHTRAEAAVFFLRMLRGVNYTPPAAIGIFDDVPTSSWHAGWVEAAYNAGLTLPCETDSGFRYCPDEGISRAMTAYMMVQAKGLPLPAPRSTDLVARRLEVTQAAQDWNQSVRLVTNKRTFVRFFASSTDGTPRTYALLRAQRGSNVTWLKPINTGNYIYVPGWPPNRTMLDHAFLFELPNGYKEGTVSLTAVLNPGIPERGREPWETNYSNNTIFTIVTFEPVPEVNVAIYRLGYRQSGNSYWPEYFHASQMESWLRRAYPMRDLRIWHYLITNAFDHLPTCGEANAYLNEIRASNSTLPPGTRYYGMVDDGGGFMRGCAQGIPSFVASGPTGTNTWGWDNDGSYGDWYGGHELGHSYGRGHANFCGAVGGPSYPYPEGRISPTLSGTEAKTIFGFDITTREIYPPDWHDMMTYCERLWLGDYTYEGLMTYFQSGLEVALPDDYGLDQIDRLRVLGTIDPTSNQVFLQPLFVLPNMGNLEPRTPGSYAIVLRGASDAELTRYPFTPDEMIDVNLLAITELVPYVTGTTRVDIEGPGGVLTSVIAGATQPSITLLAPNGGGILANNPITVSWTASDADGDPLIFKVDYSRDNGTTWQLVAQNVTGNSVAIEAINIPSAAQGRFRAWVSDGIHTASDISDAPFTVPNHAPSVEITNPSGAVTIVVSQTLMFEAHAYDADTGSMDDSQLQWFSSLAGPLGNSAQLSTASLSEGAHTITIQADDGAGGVVSDTVQVMVVSDPSQGPVAPDGLIAGPTFIVFDPTAGITSTRLSIGNQNGLTPITWNAITSQPWVELNTVTGTVPSDIVVTFKPANLAGINKATITLNSPEAPGTSVTVNVQVILKRVYLPIILK